jgi:hypothetical protein
MAECVPYPHRPGILAVRFVRPVGASSAKQPLSSERELDHSYE